MIAHRAGQQPHRRVDDRERRRLAAAQHEVAERDLLGREMVGDALVDVLVVAAEQRELSASPRIAPRRPARSVARGVSSTIGPVGAERFDRLEERLGLHHHPGAAAVRIVVDRAMAVVRVVAQVDDAVLDAAPPPPRAREC